MVLAACGWAIPMISLFTDVDCIALTMQQRVPDPSRARAQQVGGSPAGIASPLARRDGIASPVMCCMLTCASPNTIVPSSGTCRRPHSAQGLYTCAVSKPVNLRVDTSHWYVVVQGMLRPPARQA
jgi:hypothetical protein